MGKLSLTVRGAMVCPYDLSLVVANNKDITLGDNYYD